MGHRGEMSAGGYNPSVIMPRPRVSPMIFIEARVLFYAFHKTYVAQQQQDLNDAGLAKCWLQRYVQELARRRNSRRVDNLYQDVASGPFPESFHFACRAVGVRAFTPLSEWLVTAFQASV